MKLIDIYIYARAVLTTRMFEGEWVPTPMGVDDSEFTRLVKVLRQQ